MGKLLLLTIHLSLLEEPGQVKQEHLILQSDLKEGDPGLPNHAKRRPPLHVNANNLCGLQHRQKLLHLGTVHLESQTRLCWKGP